MRQRVVWIQIRHKKIICKKAYNPYK
jgi:hypothetical protein